MSVYPQGTDQRSIDITRSRVQRLINMDAVPGYLVGALLDEIDKLADSIERLRNDIQELTCGDPRRACPNCRGDVK